jgi:hypothetical protein
LSALDRGGLLRRRETDTGENRSGVLSCTRRSKNRVIRRHGLSRSAELRLLSERLSPGLRTAPLLAGGQTCVREDRILTALRAQAGMADNRTLRLCKGLLRNSALSSEVLLAEVLLACRETCMRNDRALAGLRTYACMAEYRILLLRERLRLLRERLRLLAECALCAPVLLPRRQAGMGNDRALAGLRAHSCVAKHRILLLRKQLLAECLLLLCAPVLLAGRQACVRDNRSLSALCAQAGMGNDRTLALREALRPALVLRLHESDRLVTARLVRCLILLEALLKHGLSSLTF